MNDAGNCSKFGPTEHGHAWVGVQDAKNSKKSLKGEVVDRRNATSHKEPNCLRRTDPLSTLTSLYHSNEMSPEIVQLTDSSGDLYIPGSQENLHRPFSVVRLNAEDPRQQLVRGLIQTSESSTQTNGPVAENENVINFIVEELQKSYGGPLSFQYAEDPGAIPLLSGTTERQQAKPISTQNMRMARIEHKNAQNFVSNTASGAG